jgi:tellurite resistance protein
MPASSLSEARPSVECRNLGGAIAPGPEKGRFCLAGDQLSAGSYQLERTTADRRELKADSLSRSGSVGLGYRGPMTPTEKNIVKSLIAVAWADGTVKEPEQGIIDGLLWAFDASDAEDAELREYAKKKQTLDGAPLDGLARADKEMLLANAALITHADGKQTKTEQKMLVQLTRLLGLSNDEAKPIVQSARQRANKLAGKIG